MKVNSAALGKANPTMVLIHTGKKQIATAIAILLCEPKPSAPISTGARTIFGSACKAIAYGVIAVRMNGEVPRVTPMVIPKVTPIVQAITTDESVLARSSHQ